MGLGAMPVGRLWEVDGGSPLPSGRGDGADRSRWRTEAGVKRIWSRRSYIGPFPAFRPGQVTAALFAD